MICCLTPIPNSENLPAPTSTPQLINNIFWLSFFPQFFKSFFCVKVSSLWNERKISRNRSCSIVKGKNPANESGTSTEGTPCQTTQHLQGTVFADWTSLLGRVKEENEIIIISCISWVFLLEFQIQIHERISIYSALIHIIKQFLRHRKYIYLKIIIFCFFFSNDLFMSNWIYKKKQLIFKIKFAYKNQL